MWWPVWWQYSLLISWDNDAQCVPASTFDAVYGLLVPYYGLAGFVTQCTCFF